MKTLKYCYLFIAILANHFMTAQPYDFRHYSIENGLSQSVVNCITIDEQGFIWFGTQNGLNRFDGYKFKKIANNPNDGNSISDNWIFSIVHDANKNMWCATKMGLSRRDRRTGNFTHVLYKSLAMEQLIKNDVVYGLDISKNGDILINTPPFLSIYNIESGKVSNYKSSFKYNGAILDQSLPVLEDHKGTVWVGSTEGLGFFNPGDSKINPFELPIQLGANVESVSALFEDSKGRIWIGRQSGIDILQRDSTTFKIVNSYNLNKLTNFSTIRAIAQSKDGNIWLGTEGNGLYCIIFKDKIFENFEVLSFRSIEGKTNSLSHDIILSLRIDQSDILWIGTIQGVDCIDLKPKKFGIIRKSQDSQSVDLLDNVIASIYKESNDLWIGNWGKGLNVLNLDSKKVSKYSTGFNGKWHLSNNYVHVIYRDTDKRIWIGTREGIFIFNRNLKIFYSLKDFFPNTVLPDFSDCRVYSIMQDIHNNYWIGTSKGLFKIEINSKKFIRFYAEAEVEYRLSNNLVYALLEDYKGHIWIGTANGLNEYFPESGKIKHFSKLLNIKNSLCDNYVVSLCQDKNNNLWIGTKNGVNKFSDIDSTFSYFSVENGLPGNLVYSIIMDNNDDLWFATGNGFAGLKYNSNTFRKYDIEDGLQGLEFNLNAAYKSENGQIFIGGMKGLNFFHPDSLYDNSIIPTIAITNIEILNKKGKRSFDPELIDKIVLKHDDYAFNIEFSALEYTNPSKNQYAYILEGLSDEWIDIGNRPFITFSDIKEGEYTLKIKGSNNDGIWNEKGVSLFIEKKPPIWRTKIAYFSYSVFLIMLVFFIVQLRFKTIVRERKNLEIQVAMRTSEIQKQKDEIAVQRDEIEAQRDYTAMQRDRLKQMNDSITDSIEYARRIQTAILPTYDFLNKVFKESFILYLPKDIVSGDFYWVKELIVNNYRKLYFAVVDCTGHGIPGGFVGMLGITLLNEIVSEKSNLNPAQILNLLREQVKKSFQQTWDNKGSKDGMDISLCMIDYETSRLFYSGANSRIHVYQNHKLVELKGNNMPVGIYYNEKPFTNQLIDLNSNDVIYVYSDGYQDQFGGDKGLKFMRNSFTQLLNSIYQFPLDKQKAILYKTLKDWTHEKYGQVDDITILGVRY